MNNIVVLILILSVFCQTLRCVVLCLLCVTASPPCNNLFNFLLHNMMLKLKKSGKTKEKRKKKDYSWLMKEEEPPSKEERV